MQPWSQLVLIACAVALTAAVVSAVLALGGALRRTEALLGIVEQELRPLIAQVHGVTEEVRDLTRELRLEVKRVGDVTEKQDLAGRCIVHDEQERAIEAHSHFE